MLESKIFFEWGLNQRYVYKLNSECALISGIIRDKKIFRVELLIPKKIGVKFVCEKCKNGEKYV